MLRYAGDASRDVDEVVEFSATPEDAAAALHDVLVDEPGWRDELCVFAVDLTDAAASAAISLN